MIYKFISLSNNYSTRVVKISVMKRNKRCNVKSGKWLYKQMTTIIQNQRHSKTNDNPNPISIQLRRPTQRSPDCHLIRAFVAQPIMCYTWGTPAPHDLLRKQRHNRHANHKGRGLDPPGSEHTHTHRDTHTHTHTHSNYHTLPRQQ